MMADALGRVLEIAEVWVKVHDGVRKLFCGLVVVILATIDGESAHDGNVDVSPLV
jgi:hypothetical protein